MSCDISSTTAASCQASVGELHVSGTLKPKDLNWIPVPVTTSYEGHKTNDDAMPSSSSYWSAVWKTGIPQETSSTVPALNGPLSNERQSKNDSVLLEDSLVTSQKLFEEERSEPFMTEVLYTSGFALLVFAYLLF